ncbi:MAG: Sua5/YciO/YrdC/YwlC family protein, partial [Bacteroidota bacterium]
ITGKKNHKGFIVLLSSIAVLDKFFEKVPVSALEFYKKTSQPLTIVFEKGKNVAPEVLGPTGSIAIRITSHPFCKELIEFCKVPLVSTSANFSGKPSPVTHRDIDPDLAVLCDFIVPLPEEKPLTTRPSKIIRFTDDGGIFTIRE